MSNELNVYQRINAVMSECEYVQKKQAQQGKGVRYDEVIAMLRDLLIKHGLVIVVRQAEMESLKGFDGNNQVVYQGRYEMDIINMDNPEEKVTHSTYAHGMDGGDKAPGKAHTYAVKTMLVKGFGIETGEDEESRAEKIDKANTIDGEQFKELAKYCLTEDLKNWTPLGAKLAKAYKINSLSLLPVSKFNEAIKRCKEASNGNN